MWPNLPVTFFPIVPRSCIQTLNKTYEKHVCKKDMTWTYFICLCIEDQQVCLLLRTCSQVSARLLNQAMRHWWDHMGVTGQSMLQSLQPSTTTMSVFCSTMRAALSCSPLVLFSETSRPRPCPSEPSTANTCTQHKGAGYSQQILWYFTFCDTLRLSWRTDWPNSHSNE